MNEKRKITDEEKRQIAKLFKGIIPNNTLDEDDILWIMNEVENGNTDISFEEFAKAKKERKGSHKTCKTCEYYYIPYCVDDNNFPCRSCISHNKWTAKKSEEPHFCSKCKYQTRKADEEPCKNCNEWPHPGSLTMDSKWEPKEAEDAHLCKDCKFAEKPVFKEPCSSCFKWEDNCAIYHKNWQPKDKEEEEKDDVKYPVYDEQYFRQKLAHIKTDIKDVSDRLTSLTTGLIEDDLKNRDRFAYIDRRMDDILEKLNNIEQIVMKNSVGINTTYEKASAVHDEVCKDEDICKDCNYYGMCSGYEGDMIYCKDFKKKDISSAKESPKFKVGDIVKMTDDPKHDDFFICRIKWSEHSKQWNYLISLDLEDISSAFWRMERWLTKSEDHSEPLFNVGDKVKLKAGKTVYTVLSVTHFMRGDRKVYRYRISHSATTPHYENENRLIKA